MYKITVPVFFEAAHQLPDSEDLITKACARLHGHTYHCVVSFNAESNDRGGMVVDFKAIKNVVNLLDHQYINEIFDKFHFDETPTAENIAKFIYREIKSVFPELKDLEIYIAEGYKGKEHSSYVCYS